MKKDLQMLGEMIGALFLLGCCFMGFLLGISGSSGKSDMFWVVKPIHQINGIAVDSKGNIYVGNGESSAIQVFQADGTFLYGFFVPVGREGGHFVFGIDEWDVIHVATTRRYCQYEQGIEIYERQGEYEELEELKNQYNMSEGRRFHTEDVKYRLSLFHRFIITQADGSKEVTILQAPYWPLSGFVWWGLGVAVMFLLLVQIGRISGASANQKKRDK